MLVYAAFRACPADASAKLGLPPSGLPASPSTRPAQQSRLNKDLVQAVLHCPHLNLYLQARCKCTL